MPETKILDAQLGSRHRAALGITEETDAVVVVVSEERGTISFCFSGNIVSNLDGASLRQALLGLFGRAARKKGKKLATPAGRVSIPSSPPPGGRPIGTPQSDGAPATPTTAPFAVGSQQAPAALPLPSPLASSIAASPPPPIVPGSRPPQSVPPGFPNAEPMPDTHLPPGLSLSEAPSAPSVTSMIPPAHAPQDPSSGIDTARASDELPQSPIDGRIGSRRGADE
jgi:diadenylate cyclase